ncbi:uncharacterized protein CEXT_780641 [Caerostris extrusa]|uniref:Uncharacterized protein n=1 Tax=Caerostris extrusa TaxID=172846 RepID=A0AAV4XDX6_CAEEX|nr:uncharacterized protein CEXT_780641 [Caerostris extrusa]
MKEEAASDVNDAPQMALASPSNETEEACSPYASQSPDLSQSTSISREGVVNDGFVNDTEREIFVDTCFVDGRSQSRIHSGYPKVDSARDLSSSELCIVRQQHSGIAALRPRRLWFERRHWGSILPREAQDHSGVQFQEVGQAHLGGGRVSCATSPSKVVYSIGVFYSDTDLCGKSSDETETGDHASGDPTDKQIVVCSSDMTSNQQGIVGEGGMNPSPHDQQQHPRRSSSNSCRSTRRLTTHTQLTPDTFSPPPPDSPTPDNNALPDILNSHMPPPYSTLPPTSGGRRLPPPSHLSPRLLPLHRVSAPDQQTTAGRPGVGRVGAEPSAVSFEGDRARRGGGPRIHDQPPGRVRIGRTETLLWCDGHSDRQYQVVHSNDCLCWIVLCHCGYCAGCTQSHWKRTPYSFASHDW